LDEVVNQTSQFRLPETWRQPFQQLAEHSEDRRSNFLRHLDDALEEWAVVRHGLFAVEKGNRSLMEGAGQRRPVQILIAVFAGGFRGE
jgi:hypothetical protein